MTDGQVKVYFAGEGTKEFMEHHEDWTSKLPASAKVAGPIYQVLMHDMPLSFEPQNAEHLKLLRKANHIYIQGMIIQRAAWIKKSQQPGKKSGSLILRIDQAIHTETAIKKGFMWQYELKSTELFRSGFRTMQCFNCQKYGHIAKICPADSKCGHCAGEQNTRNCTEK